MATGVDWVIGPDGVRGETWQVVSGCTPVSDECRFCYAARQAASHQLRDHPRYKGLATLDDAGVAHWTGEVRCNHDQLEKPLHWKRPRAVFVANMADLFHKDVPDAYVNHVWEVMADTPQHTYMVLTKRPERMCNWLDMHPVTPGGKHMTTHMNIVEWPLRNVWLGTICNFRQCPYCNRPPFHCLK